MAQIRDIQLDMGQLQDQQAYADVQFSIEFSENELRRNLQYGLYAGLFYNDGRFLNTDFENNGAYQTYMMPAYPTTQGFGFGGPSPYGYGQFGGGMQGAMFGSATAGNGQFGGGFGSSPMGTGTYGPNEAAGFVCWICKEAIQPMGNRTHHIERRVSFDFARMPQSNTDYRALVWALPEISEGQAFSRPVSQAGANPQPYRMQPMMF